MVVRNDFNALNKSPLVVDLLFVVINEFKFNTFKILFVDG